MFEYVVEFATEVNQPVEKVWEFTINPKNWTKYNPYIETINSCENPSKDSIVHIKFKEKDKWYPLQFKEMATNEKIVTFIKSTNFTHEATTEFYSLSAVKTRIIEKVTIKSWLVPFVKSHLKKQTETIHNTYINKLINSKFSS